jgi:hypothetical protein
MSSGSRGRRHGLLLLVPWAWFFWGKFKPSIYFGHFWLWLSEIRWHLPPLIGYKFILDIFSRPQLAR